MKRSFVLLLLVALVSGCASAFKPSHRTMQLKSSMDRKTALDVFNRYTKAQPGNSGFCGGGIVTDPGTPISVNDNGYTMRAYKLGDEISREKKDKVTRITYKKDYYVAERKFSDVSKIRVNYETFRYGDCKKPSGNEVTLSLYYGTSDFDAVMVARPNLDEMMAALLVLAPNPKLMEGTGF